MMNLRLAVSASALTCRKPTKHPSHLIVGGFFMGRTSMSHYQIANSVLFSRAQGKNVNKELKAYSRKTLQDRANNGNAEAKKLIKQLEGKDNG